MKKLFVSLTEEDYKKIKFYVVQNKLKMKDFLPFLVRKGFEEYDKE